MNNALRAPSTDFARVRDRREAIPLYVDVDLSTSRFISTALVLPIAGNCFYIDANPNDGVAVIKFQDTNYDRGTPPIYCGPGAIFKIPFTQISIENNAQPGKKIRIIYGVDLEFIAGSIASVQAQISASQFTPAQATKLVSTVSSVLVGSSTARKYLMIQNNGATDIYINLSGVAATIADGLKIAAGGGTYEFSAAMPTNNITAISSANNNSVIVAEG